MRCAAMFFAKLSPEEFNKLNYGNDEIVIIDYNILVKQLCNQNIICKLQTRVF